MMADLRKTVLLVENTAEYVLRESEQIEAEGFDVITADNGETAASRVEKDPGVDLVIVSMDPNCGIRGIQAAERILQIRDMPLLFLADRLEPETIERTENLPHYGLILRSTGNSALLSSIRMAFRLHNNHLESRIREQLLRESEEKFSKSFYLTPLSMAISLASDRRYIEVNDAFISLTGYSREEIMGRNSLELGLWMDAETKTQVNQEIATAGEAHNVPVRLRTKSGEIREVIYSAAAVSLGGAPHVVSQVLDISERKRAEEENRVLLTTVQEEKTKLSALIDSMADEVWFADTQGRFTLANPSALKEFGLISGEMIEVEKLATSLEVFRPDGSPRPVDEAPPLRAFAGEVVRNQEEIVRTPAAGELRYRQVSSTPVKDAEGKIIGVISVARDITERKRAEEALQKSEEKYRVLVENANEAILVIQDGVLKFANARASELFGYSFEDGVGRAFNEFIHPDDIAMVTERYRKRLGGEISMVAYPFRMIHKDGKIRWVEINSVLISWEERPAVMSYLRDITDAKRAEEALGNERLLLRTLIDNIPDSIYSKDLACRKTLANPAEVRFLGAKWESEVLGKDDFAFYPKEMAEGFFADDQSVMRSGQPVLNKEEFVINENGQQRWLLTSKLPLKDGKGNIAGLVGIGRDITERKQLEERVRQVRHDLLFAVSHDLKTPLQALNQSQEMLSALEPGEGLASFQKYREIWRRNLQRLERMINNLVDSQRGQEDHFPLLLVPCSLEEIIQQVVEDLTGFALSSQVSFDLNLQAVPEVSCDKEAIGRVVENLLTNAIKFSPKGGKVEVRLGMEGGAHLLEVEDDGAGIPANEQAQLFQPFQRGRLAQQKQIPGTGLGLYVCRRIVEEHGGSISLQSAVGVGTIVTVRLPYESPATSPPKDSEATGEK